MTEQTDDDRAAELERVRQARVPPDADWARFEARWPIRVGRVSFVSPPVREHDPYSNVHQH